MRREGDGDLVAHTNIADEDAAVFHLARRGYGSVVEIKQMDTPQFLDLVEFEQIYSDLELYHSQQAQNGNGR